MDKTHSLHYNRSIDPVQLPRDKRYILDGIPISLDPEALRMNICIS